MTAAALPQPPPSPDPGDDQSGFVIPHRFVRILAVLRALLGFGQQRMTGLEQSWPQLTAATTRRLRHDRLGQDLVGRHLGPAAAGGADRPAQGPFGEAP